jgi:hypothetical protein
VSLGETGSSPAWYDKAHGEEDDDRS